VEKTTAKLEFLQICYASIAYEKELIAHS